MTVTLTKTSFDEPVTVSAPPSKSMAHRMLILASLSDCKSKILCKGSSLDIEATIKCLNAMGAVIDKHDDVISVTPIKRLDNIVLDVGESGSTLRFLLPILGALGIKAEIIMHGRLPERPIEPLKSQLIHHGMTIIRQGNTLTVGGKLTHGVYTIDGGISSQFITGLMLALPLLGGESRLNITNERQSKPYIKMTLAALDQFGVTLYDDGSGFDIPPKRFKSGGKYSVEGDWSGAAFMLCAGALREKGVTVDSLCAKSTQGDKKIVELLRLFGASVQDDGGKISVSKGQMTGITIDARDIPDLVPALSVVAAAAKGTTEIINAGRLRMKESDRIKSTCAMLKGLGVTVKEGLDSITITGGNAIKGGIIDGYGDHRIVMSAGIASLMSIEGVTVSDAEAAAKSYPDFWSDLEKIGVCVKPL